MLKKSLIVIGAVVLATSAFAQSSTSKNAPGQQMQRDQQQNKPSTGPGASEYAPGQKMQDANKNGTNTGNGASNYAPPNQTTGSGLKK